MSTSRAWKRICHWGPLIALGIIICVSCTAIYCNSMWWPIQGSLNGLLHTALFFSLSTSTAYNLLYSMYTGPGYLPLGWFPENEEDCQHLQYCLACQGYKAPRSHHCRKCNRCIMKMDHHCPWINHCVGHKNHTSFILFLFSAVCGCTHACVIITCTLYRALNINYYYYLHQFDSSDVPLITMGLWLFIICLFSVGLAFGVVVSVGFLLVVQLKTIVRNRTGIEDWVMEKAVHRREETDEVFIYPYNLGWRANIGQVLNWRCRPRGDGIVWDVRPGCHQFTLTIEQIEQKKAKRERAVDYRIIRPYAGKWFPLTFGFSVCIHPPCTDEPRIVLNSGDVVAVTRWKRYWLYGEIKARGDGEPLDASQRRSNRGWFPRLVCTILSSPSVDLIREQSTGDSSKKND